MTLSAGLTTFPFDVAGTPVTQERVDQHTTPYQNKLCVVWEYPAGRTVSHSSSCFSNTSLLIWSSKRASASWNNVYVTADTQTSNHARCVRSNSSSDMQGPAKWNNATVTLDAAMEAGTGRFELRNRLELSQNCKWSKFPRCISPYLFVGACRERGTLEGRWYLWKAIPILPLPREKAGKSQLLSI